MAGHKGMGAHHSASAATVVWLTPPEITEALGGADSFDLDPCAPFRSPLRTARRAYSWIFQDGLAAPWDGRVWLNPPYTSTEIGRWLAKLADHGRGTALIFARTETQTFHRQVWERAHGLLFVEGRLHFHDRRGERAKANAGAPSVLVAYGAADLDRLAASGLAGQLVPLRFSRFAMVRALADASWRDEVMAFVRARGGTVDVADLYRHFERHPKAERNPNWRAKLRQTVQRAGLRRVASAKWAEAS